MTSNLTAALLVIAAMTLISCNDAIMKTMTDSLGIGQVLFFRGLMAIILFIVIFKVKKMPIFPKVAFSRINLARASFEMAATLCFITALSLIPIATASTLVWTSPILSTFLAAIILKEHVSLLRWSCVLTGFIGIVIVTNPFAGNLNLILLLPLLAAVFVSSRDIVTRHIPLQLNSLYITFATIVLVTIAGAILSLFDWRAVEIKNLFALAFAACLLSLGFFCQISAIRKGELSFIAPFSYSGIIVAILLGIVFWQEYPTPSMYLGILLIIGSGIVITLNQNKNKTKLFRAT